MKYILEIFVLLAVIVRFRSISTLVGTDRVETKVHWKHSGQRCTTVCLSLEDTNPFLHTPGLLHLTVSLLQSDKERLQYDSCLCNPYSLCNPCFRWRASHASSWLWLPSRSQVRLTSLSFLPLWPQQLLTLKTCQVSPRISLMQQQYSFQASHPCGQLPSGPFGSTFRSTSFSHWHPLFSLRLVYSSTALLSSQTVRWILSRSGNRISERGCLRGKLPDQSCFSKEVVVVQGSNQKTLNWC